MYTKVALDVGIICPQAPDHINNTREEVVGAAEAYARRKRGHQATEDKCRERGILFQPLIFESTESVSKEVEDTVKVICIAVADKTNSPYASIAQQLWRRLSVDIQRAGHRALTRRLADGPLGGGRRLWATAYVAEVLQAPLHLH